jgi:hypothetical protein
VSGGASGSVTVTTPLGTTSFAGFTFVPSVKANGPTTFCSEGSVVLTSSADANNQWYRNNNLIAGATAKTYQATVSGNYTVKTTSNGITTTSPTGIDVTVTTVPTPTIAKNGSSLSSSATTGNQWFFNGTAILGATAQTYQPTQAGNYTVQSTINGCASALSQPFAYVITAVVNLSNGQFIQAYPNPVKDRLIIDYNLSGLRSVTVEILDMEGKRVMTANVQSGKAINVAALSSGVYFIRVYSKNKSFETIKMMKTNQ